MIRAHPTPGRRRTPAHTRLTHATRLCRTPFCPCGRLERSTPTTGAPPRGRSSGALPPQWCAYVQNRKAAGGCLRCALLPMSVFVSASLSVPYNAHFLRGSSLFETVSNNCLPHWSPISPSPRAVSSRAAAPHSSLCPSASTSSGAPSSWLRAATTPPERSRTQGCGAQRSSTSSLSEVRGRLHRSTRSPFPGNARTCLSAGIGSTALGPTV